MSEHDPRDGRGTMVAEEVVRKVVHIFRRWFKGLFDDPRRGTTKSYPNLFSKNFKADASRVGTRALAKKWRKRNCELLLAALIYADRYVRAHGLKHFSPFRLLGVASLCAVKHWLEERNRHINLLFAQALDLPVKRVNYLERVFLVGIGHSLSLSPEDFSRFLLERSRHLKREGDDDDDPGNNAARTP